MTRQIYFDNAATTPLDPRVLEAMMPYLTDFFGNGSSIHGVGRKAKVAIENARKKIALLLNTSPAELFFTSGGTEANNTVMRSCPESLGVKHIITSPLEHHAVLHPAEHLEKLGLVQVELVRLRTDGEIDLDDLGARLSEKPQALVSLMHGNNEIGNLLPIKAVSKLCKEHGALFHSDTVQTIGKFPIDLQALDLDFVSGSAHKLHGPKGVGFLYVNARNKINPLLFGGAQERNMRGGTENVAAIVGMAKALELAMEELETRKTHILGLKAHMKAQLEQKIEGVAFNGKSGELEGSLYNILNVRFPAHRDNEMLLFNLDIEGICASGGSACSSGTDIGSHVLRGIEAPQENANVRFSFSDKNTTAEVDETVTVLAKIFGRS